MTSATPSRWSLEGRERRARRDIPQEAIAELLEAVDLRALVSEPPQGQSDETHWIDCPFHVSGRTRRTLWIERHRFGCTSCAFRGTALGWLMYHEGFSFVEALDHLSRLSGTNNAATPSKDALTNSAALRRERLARASRHFHRALEQSDRARSYLAGRDIATESTERFVIGWSSTTGDELRARSGHDRRALWQAGLLLRDTEGRYRPRFRERLMFPIRNRAGDVIGFGARRIVEPSANPTDRPRSWSGPKYLNSPSAPWFDKSRTLYGEYEAREAVSRHGHVVLLEGYTDVITLSQAGIGQVVAALGTSVTEQHLERALTLAPRLTICLDGDEKGQERAISALSRALPIVGDEQSVDVLKVPDGMDPDEFVRRSRGEAFEEILARDCVPIEQALLDARGLPPDEDVGAKARFGTYACELIARARSGVLARRLQERAESVIGIALEVEEDAGGAREGPPS